MSQSLKIPGSTIAGVEFPKTDLIIKCIEHVEAHSTPLVVNHVLRSAIFALLAVRKIPHLQTVDHETITVAMILHDLGWAEDLKTTDKRFEIDGANAARDFVRKYAPNWDTERVQLVWDAVAFHATITLAVYGRPTVAAACMGPASDILGTDTPGSAISEEQFREVFRVLPRDGFADGFREILCGLCVTKPESTYDNFVGEFGEKYVSGFAAKKFGNLDVIEAGLENMKKYES